MDIEDRIKGSESFRAVAVTHIKYFIQFTIHVATDPYRVEIERMLAVAASQTGRALAGSVFYKGL